jgi:chromosomal replication initiator protein
MYLSRELTPMSLPSIGKRFHRDHTTVIHAIKAVERRILCDLELVEDIAILRERLSVDQEREAVAA